MTDLETRLREAMLTAVPEHLDSTGLTEGARRYAVRSRRLRVGGAALVAAVVVGIVGTSTSGLFRDRATEPAVPTPRPSAVLNLCPQLQETTTALTAVPPQPFSARAKAVLVCALVGGDSVWPGSLPPDEAVDRPATLDTLDWRLRSDRDAGQCGDRPRGRAFTVSYRDLVDGDHTYVNTDLLCDGWVFLDSYYIALSEQGTDYWAHQPATDSYLPCPSLVRGLGENPAGKPVPLPKGTVFTTATVCAHPTTNPRAVTDDTVPRILYVRRGAVGERDLALLNANLARTGAGSDEPGCTGTATLNVTFVVRALTSTGEQVALTAHTTCLPHFHVNDQRRVTITLDQATVDALTGPLDRFP